MTQIVGIQEATAVGLIESVLELARVAEDLDIGPFELPAERLDGVSVSHNDGVRPHQVAVAFNQILRCFDQGFVQGQQNRNGKKYRREGKCDQFLRVIPEKQ
jgi:hypothetical protein